MNNTKIKLRGKAYGLSVFIAFVQMFFVCTLCSASPEWEGSLELLLNSQAGVISEQSFIGTKPERLGLAEIVNGERLERPKDFADKNAFSIQDQHSVVKSLMFPGESNIEAYQNPQRYPQGYVKFFIYGGNDNQTFNDDDYEYDDIGLPFLKNLGQAIYKIELERPRQYRPDLSDLKYIIREQ